MRFFRLSRTERTRFALAFVMSFLLFTGFTTLARAADTPAPPVGDDLALAWAWGNSLGNSSQKSETKSCGCVSSGRPCTCESCDCDGNALKSGKLNPLAACVGIDCNGGMASGTAIVGAPKGKTWIVTAKHVVDMGNRNITAGGKVYPGTLVTRHPNYDLALLSIDAEIPAISIATAGPKTAVTMKAYGTSYSFDQPRSGYVSSPGKSIGVTIPHGPGDSGGGYIDSAGRLVGVLAAGYRGTTYSVGSGAEAVREILPTSPIASRSQSDDEGVTVEVINTPGGGTARVRVRRNPLVAEAPPCPGGRCQVGSGSYATVSQGGTRTIVATDAGEFDDSSSPTVGSGSGRVGLFHPLQRLHNWNQNRPHLLGGGRFRQGGGCSSCGG